MCRWRWECCACLNFWCTAANAYTPACLTSFSDKSIGCCINVITNKCHLWVIDAVCQKCLCFNIRAFFGNLFHIFFITNEVTACYKIANAFCEPLCSQKVNLKTVVQKQVGAPSEASLRLILSGIPSFSFFLFRIQRRMRSGSYISETWRVPLLLCWCCSPQRTIQMVHNQSHDKTIYGFLLLLKLQLVTLE